MKENSRNTKFANFLKKVWKNDEKNWSKFGIIAIPKEKNEGIIIGMFYIVYSFMWMTIQKWHLMYLKSCVICCVIPILFSPSTQEWFFFKSNILLQTNGIKYLKKHFDVNHSKNLRKFEEEINSTMKGNVEK
jgi:hypothetical protein